MKLEKYIRSEIKKGRRRFNITLNHKGEHDKKGLNKVIFSVKDTTEIKKLRGELEKTQKELAKATDVISD